ncbi:MAG TPA: hypothetical protein VE650_07345, partial [Acetobacteraceae bacterium]|nr:hypothetical protein [Acetobacteraceae bacterium]
MDCESKWSYDFHQIQLWIQLWIPELNSSLMFGDAWPEVRLTYVVCPGGTEPKSWCRSGPAPGDRSRKTLVAPDQPWRQGNPSAFHPAIVPRWPAASGGP